MRPTPGAPAHTLPSAALHPAPRTTAVAANGWPEPTAALTAAARAYPPGFGVRKVFLDPGHGAENNSGNTSCRCVAEADFTLRASEELARRLEATGHFAVRVAREGSALVAYRDRVEAAGRWGAEAFVSIHSDVRGAFDQWEPEPGQSCPVSWAAPGFSVLWSDEGEPARTDGRLALARAVGRRLGEAGFAPYLGADYALYQADTEVPGVFVDRHAPEQRIFVLRRPTMTSVLVETHHALDPREVARWDDPHTHDVFASVIAAALVDVLGARPDAGR
jgi:N-acetylmuramoyl-L-alanine amidase